MADHALKAKQRAAERALKRVDVLQQQGAMEKKLLKRVRAALSCVSSLLAVQPCIPGTCLLAACTQLLSFNETVESPRHAATAVKSAKGLC